MMNGALALDLAVIENNQDIHDQKLNKKYPEYNMFFRVGME